MESTSPYISIEFFNERLMVLGNAIEDSNGFIKINVLRENFNNPKLFDDFSSVNQIAFATAVVTLQHECRHVQQSGKYPLNNDISDNVLISHYISKENEDWYNQHYTTQLNEIDAEMNAIYMAQSKLEKAFPGHGEELVLQYVNYRIDKDNETIQNGVGMAYYIHSRKHFTNLNDVFDKFEEAVRNAEKEVRLYSNKTKFNTCTDTVVLGMDIKNYDSSVWKEHIDILDSAETGVQSDLLMTSFTNYAKGNAYDNPLMQHINLDIEEIYGIPPAQSQDELTQDMKDHEYEASASSNRESGQMRHSDEQEFDDFEL